MFFVMLSPLAAAQSSSSYSYCSDSNTLNSTSYVFIDNNKTTITQNQTCQYGCVGTTTFGRCGGNPASIPVEIYVFIGALSFLFMVLAFIKIHEDHVIIFPWLSFGLSVFLTIASTSILMDSEIVESVGLIWLWAGISVVQFVLAIYFTFLRVTDDITENMSV